MNYEARLKKLEAQAQPPERANLRVVHSCVVADGAGGWAGVEIWERSGERVFHSRIGNETITECLERAHGEAQDTIRVQFVPENPRWLTPDEYRKSGRTDLGWFSTEHA